MDKTLKQRKVWSQHLHRMRGPGARRKQQGKPSLSLAPLLARLPKGSTIIDLGCGESGDRNVARKTGFTAYGIDLYPPRNGDHFIQADGLALPLADSSVDGIVSHAMAALVAPFDRWRMYEEAARVLRSQGLFSITPYPLAEGFDIRMALEDDRIYCAGFHKIRTGLYVKCSQPNCTEHPHPDSFAAITLAVNRMDTDKGFRSIVPPLLGWIGRGGSFQRAVEFTGCNPDHLH